MASNNACSRCSASRPTNAQLEPCARCLLQSLFSSPTPARIGDYEILAELGRGGMGVVYEARRCGSERVVALKAMHAGNRATPDERDRFCGEIRTGERLEHPHIVRVEDRGEDAGRPYFTMKAYPGVLAREL